MGKREPPNPCTGSDHPVPTEARSAAVPGAAALARPGSPGPSHPHRPAPLRPPPGKEALPPALTCQEAADVPGDAGSVGHGADGGGGRGQPAGGARLFAPARARPRGEEAEATPPARSGTAESPRGAESSIIGAGFPATKAVLRHTGGGVSWYWAGLRAEGAGLPTRWLPPPLNAALALHGPPPVFMAAGGHRA